jgi:hypothetical protein
MCPLSPGTPWNTTLFCPRREGRSNHATLSTFGRPGTAHIFAKLFGDGITCAFDAAASWALLYKADRHSTSEMSTATPNECLKWGQGDRLTNIDGSVLEVADAVYSVGERAMGEGSNSDSLRPQLGLDAPDDLPGEFGIALRCVMHVGRDLNFGELRFKGQTSKKNQASVRRQTVADDSIFATVPQPGYPIVITKTPTLLGLLSQPGQGSFSINLMAAVKPCIPHVP